ncbi:putative N-acetylglucosaminyltransferase subunit, partial [Hortaea werneckii]
MHPVSALTFGIFLAGYITARWDLVTRLYELAIFAWDHGVITRAAKGFTILSIFFILLLIPIERIAAREAAFVSTNTSKEYSIESDDSQNPQPLEGGISAREQLRRRGDAPKDGISGILVGWRNSDLDLLVVSVLQGVEARNVDHALRVQTLFRSSPHPIDHILDRCGKHPLQVLGTLNAPSTTLHFEPKFLSLRYERRDAAPRIDCSSDTGFTVQVVVFDRPDPKRMQYLSMTPISLALADNGAAYGSLPPFNTFTTDEDAYQKRRRKLVEKLKQHTVVRHPRTPKELALPTVINQVNCSAELNDLMQSNIGLVGVRTRRSLSVSERLAESAAHLRNSVVQSTKSAYQNNVWPILSEVFIFLLMVQRILAEATLQLLDWAPFPNAAALKDISATAQQVDIRLQQFCYWPAQYLMLQKRRSDWESISYSHSEYIRFYNSLWLVANDVIIGIAIGSYILENSAHVAAFIDDLVDDYSIAGLQRMITWLENNPAGLKLNNELANFLGDLFLWVIDYWDNSVVQLRPLLP